MIVTGVSFTSLASAATALGTLVLAGVTYLMVRKTAAMVESSDKTATAAAKEAAATLRLAQVQEDQMRNARLPVVLPVFGSLGVSADSTTREIQISVPVENIGVGPALRVHIRLEMLDQYSGQSVASQPYQAPAQRAGLAAGASHVFTACFRGLATDPVFPFRVHLEFADVFATSYRVLGRFFPAAGIFKELEFQALDAKGLPVATMAAI